MMLPVLLCTIATYPIPMLQNQYAFAYPDLQGSKYGGSLPYWRHLIAKMPHSGIINKNIEIGRAASETREDFPIIHALEKQSLCADTAMRLMTISKRMFYNVNRNDAFKSFVLVTKCHILSRAA